PLIRVTLSGGGLLSAENDVGGVCGCLVFGDAEAERRQVNPGEHCFPLPEHDGGQGQMQLVDQSRAKILTHRLDAAADLHVATIGGLLRLIQCRLDTLGHKDEGGAALHLDRIARMMRQHEGRCVIGRIGAPPTLPALVRPGAADRPEHIAAEDEGAEAVHRTMCVGLIDAVRAAAPPVIARKVRVPKNHWCSSRPRLPSGFSRLCSGPAPKPPSEIEKPATRTFVIRHSLPYQPSHDCNIKIHDTHRKKTRPGRGPDLYGQRSTCRTLRPCWNHWLARVLM